MCNNAARSFVTPGFPACVSFVVKADLTNFLFPFRMGKSEFQSAHPSQHVAAFSRPQPPLDTDFYPLVCAGV